MSDCSVQPSDAGAATLISENLPSIDFPLRRLAELYQERLSAEPLSRRFAHHISHVASESWLCHELAFLVNEEGEKAGLKDWHAKLEQKRVDVTLVNQSTKEEIYLECKQVPPDWWRSNWREVYNDLGYSKEG